MVWDTDIRCGGAFVGFDAFRPEGRRFESHSRPWASPSLAIACSASACYQCC